MNSNSPLNTLQINSAHELILTELILENTFAAYEPEEMVALLSCFLFHEKTEVEPVIPPKLEEVGIFRIWPTLLTLRRVVIPSLL